MTLTQFQQLLHSEYQGDINYPASDDDEWALRTNLLRSAIDAWNDEKGILWGELWVQLSDSTQIGLVTTVQASTLDYDAPDDFKFPAGFVRVSNADGSNVAYYTVYKPEDTQNKLADPLGCYFTGNDKVGFTLHFFHQPTVGNVIDYPYYKAPFYPTSGSEIIEMSNPQFAIKFVKNILHEQDGDGDRSTKAIQEANEKLMSMKTKNWMPGFLQPNSVPDRDWDNGSPGFGN